MRRIWTAAQSSLVSQECSVLMSRRQEVELCVARVQWAMLKTKRSVQVKSITVEIELVNSRSCIHTHVHHCIMQCICGNYDTVFIMIATKEVK